MLCRNGPFLSILILGTRMMHLLLKQVLGCTVQEPVIHGITDNGQPPYWNDYWGSYIER